MIMKGKVFSRGCKLAVFVVDMGVSVWVIVGVGVVGGSVAVPLGKLGNPKGFCGGT